MVKGITGNGLLVSVAPKRWAAANLRFVFSVVTIWLVVCLGSPCIAGNATQKAGTGTDGGQPKGTPKIIATPERVKITGGSGTTDIVWNTGDGSVGYVFVTVNRRPPTLVAKGNEGSRVISWIRTGSYVFELYGDAERRTLLATVTVSGIAEAGAPQITALLQGQLRWLLVAALVAVLYVGIYLSSTGPVRTKFPVEPTKSPRPLHVARNLLLGLAAFICIDGVVFHTRLYASILAPDSYAGRLAVITRAEKDRVSSGLKEVLVLGDSRMAEGFSATVADKLSSVSGLKFVNLAEPASSVNIWDYMLREVDPTRRRYWAIVVPYGIGYEPNSADRLRISMAAPLLRYGDCFNFASIFQRWSGRFRAFTACILRGSAYQSDVVDFLGHPIARIQSIHREPKRLQSRDVYQGRDYDIVGTSYDPKTGQVTFPPRLTEAQKEAIRDSLAKPSQSETQDFLRIQREGIQRILNRYSASPTEIVLTPVPRGPFAGLPGASMTFHAAFPTVATQKAIFSLPEQTFDFLETPEYYFDGYHLNAKGRQRFTETLVTELVGRLRSANSDGRVRFDSRLVVDRFHLAGRGSDIRSATGDSESYTSKKEAN
ncbi:MAG TPA: hypothetical protein VE867_06355 [Candidatus Binatia bacterium]|nr:hypothetical protein [Candidatus Binatia bacterium]